MSGADRIPGAVTGLGSMPGTHPLEAARTVVGELPELPHLPELPARGVGADMIGRTAGLLVDLPFELVPSGYRLTSHPGRDHRRAVDALRDDVDAFEQALAEAGAEPVAVKAQVAGPWTLAAELELTRGHKVLTDHGALRDLTDSLVEGLREHLDRMARRAGTRIVVQLDEPSLPAVLAGDVPTPSGYGSVPAVAEPDARRLLSEVIERVGNSVIVHCCGPCPPIRTLCRARASAVAVDASVLKPAIYDEVGEAWQEGHTLLLGVVPSTEPDTPLEVSEARRGAVDLARAVGFGNHVLTEQTVVTPACGFANAHPRWAVRALRLCAGVARSFDEQ